MKNKKIIATCSLVACMAVTGVAFSTIKHFIGADSNTVTVEFKKTSEGKKDITAGLKKAIENASSGTKIVIPEGDYIITEGFVVDKGVTITGEGKVELNGQGVIAKTAGWKKPAADKVVTSKNYVPEYYVVNNSDDLFKKGNTDYDVFQVEASGVTIDNIQITGVYNDSTSVVPVGIRVCEGVKNTTIRNCKIHDMGCVYKKFSEDYNGHGIIVDGAEKASKSNVIINTVISNCELYNLYLGQSEALVLNGNVEGFDVVNNYVHDCDNIGIDIIGFEKNQNKDFDLARGTEEKYATVRNNVVINISSGSNTAYRADEDEDGTESCCAGGIYVDGGKYVDITNNYVENSDIGCELASEHYGLATSYVNLVNNTFVKNDELAGVSLGGCDKGNGGANNCTIAYNTIYNTSEACLNFQNDCYGSDNNINNNIIIAPKESKVFNIEAEGEVDFNIVLNNNLSNYKLPKSGSKNVTDSIEVEDYSNTDVILKTKTAIKDGGKNIYGSSVTRRNTDAKTVGEKESETQKATEKVEKESSTKENIETKPSVKETEKKTEKTSVKEETTKKEEKTTKKEEKTTKKEETSKKEESSQSVVETTGKKDDVVDNGGEITIPEAIISSSTSFYNLEERTKGMRIKYTKRKNKENWKHVDLTFSNLDLTKYSKVKIYVIPSRNGMNLGVTNMDEENPIFYRDHWTKEGKFTSTEEQVVTVDLNEDNIDGLYLYFDATKKDGASDAQRCYITKIEFE